MRGETVVPRDIWTWLVLRGSSSCPWDSPNSFPTTILVPSENVSGDVFFKDADDADGTEIVKTVTKFT